MAVPTSEEAKLYLPTSQTENWGALYNANLIQTDRGLFLTLVAGESIEAFDAVYLKNDGKMYKADASALSTLPAIGIAPNGVASAAEGLLQIAGWIDYDDTSKTALAATVSDLLYVSDVSGEIDDAAGTIPQLIGMAKTTTAANITRVIISPWLLNNAAAMLNSLIVGDATNNTTITPTGDLIFKGTGGRPYGCILGIDETITCTLQSTWYQVTFDAAGLVNLIEADVANNELEVTYEGHYKIHVTACVHSGVAHDFEFLIKKNDGAADLGPHLFQSTAVAGQVENVAGTCLIDLAANDRVELWVQCTDAAAQDIVFDHVDIVLGQEGGT